MTILEATPQHAFGLPNPRSFVAVFRGRCRTADIAAMRARLRKLTNEADAGVYVLVVMEERSTLGERGRKEIGEMLREASPRVLLWANVVEGKGFWASTVRGITTAVAMAAGHEFPLRTFSNVAEAADWLGEHSDAPSELAAHLVREMASVRGQVLPAEHELQTGSRRSWRRGHRGAPEGEP